MSSQQNPPTPSVSLLQEGAAENPIEIVFEVLNNWLDENEATDFDQNDVAHFFAMLGTAGYSIVPNAQVATPAPVAELGAAIALVCKPHAGYDAEYRAQAKAIDELEIIWDRMRPALAAALSQYQQERGGHSDKDKYFAFKAVIEKEGWTLDTLFATSEGNLCEVCFNAGYTFATPTPVAIEEGGEAQVAKKFIIQCRLKSEAENEDAWQDMNGGERDSLAAAQARIGDVSAKWVMHEYRIQCVTTTTAIALVSHDAR